MLTSIHRFLSILNYLTKLLIHLFNSIIENNGGCPPLTYLLFNQVAKMVGDPPRTCDDPDFKKVTMPIKDNHEDKFGIPSLEKLGK